MLESPEHSFGFSSTVVGIGAELDGHSKLDLDQDQTLSIGVKLTGKDVRRCSYSQSSKPVGVDAGYWSRAEGHIQLGLVCIDLYLEPVENFGSKEPLGGETVAKEGAR